MVRIGIVGSGFMAETHVDALNRIDQAEIVGIASPNTATTFIDEQDLDAKPYTSTEKMLDDAALDIVDVCSPTPTHRSVVEAAAARGLDVFCEKPLADTLVDAQAIADVVDETGISCMVGHVVCFFQQYEQIKQVVDNGGIGTPGVARARRLSEFPAWGHGNWYADRDQSGGALVDFAIHDFYYLRWIFGDIDRVFARSNVWDHGEHAHATLRFENGAVGYVEASWGLPEGQGLTSEHEFAGDNGVVEIDRSAAAVTIRDTDGTKISNPVRANGYQRQFETFLENRETGIEPPATIEDSIEALRISLAAKQSVETGKPVAIEEVDR
ncbi:Gfo/Idh/MocA family protein [Haloprofundus salinisoli]|uniref:Gfo/Idh/MocA family protein n=1 Tax=Haloprofundus salinisoli TaxID=2876193 RepID=UPI001CCAE72E|nr:Gfo/Idh/MocA family oxidoreductase [Haloprofundus salinisoli]